MGSETSEVTLTPEATHPVVMAGSQATLQLPGGGILATPILAHLWALCPLGNEEDTLAWRIQ